MRWQQHKTKCTWGNSSCQLRFAPPGSKTPCPELLPELICTPSGRQRALQGIHQQSGVVRQHGGIEEAVAGQHAGEQSTASSTGLCRGDVHLAAACS